MIKMQFIVVPIVVLIAAGLISFLVFDVGNQHANGRIVVIEPRYIADFSDDQILVGASHNVFVGVVKEELGTQELGVGPETQFEVEVIENIKEELNGTVTVNQLGGYENGVLYTVEGDYHSHDGSQEYLLQPGSVYVFATRYNKKQNWYTLNSYPTARKLISKVAGTELENLKEIATNDERVIKLKSAYPSEKLLDVDVANGQALNSYESKHAEETISESGD